MLSPCAMNDSGQFVILNPMDEEFFTPAMELALTGLETRMASQETWRNTPVAYVGAALTTNYNIVTTLLGVLVGALNTTNARVNAIQSGLQTKALFASS